MALLARLAGARRAPSARCYPDHWPGRAQRVAQVLSNLLRWWIGRRDAMVLVGAGVPSAKGPVTASTGVSWKALADGAAVLPGARIEVLVHTLGLDPGSAPEFYLADSDVLVVFGRLSQQEVVIHVATDAERIERYARCGDEARRLFEGTRFAGAIAQIVAMTDTPTYTLLVQTRLTGRVVRARDLDAEQLQNVIVAALAPLKTLSDRAATTPQGAEQALLDVRMESLGERKGICELTRVPLARLRRWQGRFPRGAVLAHGDYWLANLLFDGDGRVTGIVDWERSRGAALAGFDAVHLVAFSFAHWRGCTPMDVLCMLWEDRCEPTLSRLFVAVGDTLALSVDDLRHVAIAVWLAHLASHVDHIAGWSDAHLRDWLEQPAASLSRCPG
jgi:hypothetical protein